MLSVCPPVSVLFFLAFAFRPVFCFLFSVFGFLFLFCIHNIFTCISHWGLLYVQHERINKMQAKLHENQSPNRVELSAILGVASCRGTCQGCQHLTDLIISILFPSLSLAISSRRTMLQGERVACCIPHASCPIVMRKYGICVTIKCASHLCYPHPHECVLDPPRPGQVLLFLLLPPVVVPHGAAGAGTISLAAFCMRLNYVDNCP